jgi:hypothetical protein
VFHIAAEVLPNRLSICKKEIETKSSKRFL